MALESIQVYTVTDGINTKQVPGVSKWHAMDRAISTLGFNRDRITVKRRRKKKK
jgi:hypothetical protein